MSKMITKRVAKLKGGKKKDKNGIDSSENDDDYWQDKPVRNFNFDDEKDESNKTDFLVVEDMPNSRPSSAKSSPRLPAQSARQRGPNATAQLNRSTGPSGTSTPPRQQNASNSSPDNKSKEARLETEIFNLRNKLKDLQASSTPSINVEKALDEFMSGSNFPPLQAIVSREKKFQLLDRAIERHDGNAITRIIIWLKESLKRDPDLMKDLMNRPAAMNHYICYLKEMKEFDELFELLTTLNRSEEAAFLEYQRKLEQNKDGKVRAGALRSTVEIHFRSQRELKFESQLIDEQIKLLETQVGLAEHDKGLKLEDVDKLKVGDTLSQTLWYLYINHWADKDKITAPEHLRSKFNISDLEHEWIAITALAKKHNWDQIDAMVQKSNGLLGTLTGKFGVTNYQTAIEIKNLVDILGTYEMPQMKLRKFMNAIEDIEDRKAAACCWSEHHIALDCYKRTKDLAGLQKHLKDMPDIEETQSIRHVMQKEERISQNWR